MSDPATPHFSKQDASENKFLHRTEKENVKKKAGQGVVVSSRHGNPLPVEQKQPNRPTRAKEDIPAQGWQAAGQGYPKLSKPIPARHGEQEKTEQNGGKDIKTVRKRYATRPYQQHRNITGTAKQQEKCLWRPQLLDFTGKGTTTNQTVLHEDVFSALMRKRGILHETRGYAEAARLPG